MYDGAVACSYLAFFGYQLLHRRSALPLLAELGHPSAFRHLINTIVVFIILAVIGLAIGFGSAVNLVIVPTLFGSVMARFGYGFLPLWVVLLCYAFVAHQRARAQIADIRAKD